MDELKKMNLKGKFLVKDVFSRIKTLSHLSDSYAYDVLVAILVSAVEKKEINKLGRVYYF
jgi:hypothetical protein